MKGCYNPILIKQNRVFNKDVVIARNLRYYKRDIHSDDFSTEHIEVPCGKCLACLAKKSDEWSMRMQHEAIKYNYGNNGMFITLTYNNDNLPDNYSLKKSDLQNFFKRVRYYIGKRKIKYFACGEYGTLKKRPHYHAIILGMSYYNQNDIDIINKSWKNGLLHIGYVSQESTIYTAKYMQKDNLLFLNAKEYKVLTKREKPFRVMSKGIGKDYAFENFHNFIKNMKIGFNGAFLSIPRTYIKWYYKKYGVDSLREKLKKYSLENQLKDLWSLSKRHSVDMFVKYTNEKTNKFTYFINNTLQNIIENRKNIQQAKFKRQGEYYFDKKYQINLLKPLEIS